jgi:hypothetical protein
MSSVKKKTIPLKLSMKGKWMVKDVHPMNIYTQSKKGNLL